VPFGAVTICGASTRGSSQERSGAKILTYVPVTLRPSFDKGAAQIVVSPEPGRLLLSDFQTR
jgi:hypothetical protein